MTERLHDGARDQRGFTLIELLVVILIIGILAAIAIPSFLNQTTKGYDASAKELARTAETTGDTIATDNSGTFGNVTVANLFIYEPTLFTTSATAGNNAWLQSASGNSDSYVVTAEAYHTNDLFSIVDNKGMISRSCGKAGSWTPPAATTPTTTGTGVGSVTASGYTGGGCANGAW